MDYKRIVIFTGGQLTQEFLQEIQPDDVIIAADRGALYLIEHGIQPHIAVGDFDSITEEEREIVNSNSVEFIACDPIHKDLTDTEMAFETALDHEPTHILIFGATGTRMDHTLANVHIMVRAMQHHISCALQDEHNYMTLTTSSAVVEQRGFTYVSLLPLTHEVTGICLEGFMYPLDHATIRMGQSLGISNKLLDKSGTVTIDSGLLLIIQSKD
ncbi:thiamine diphosphokinase [Paenibacillus polysaccharolyticus]|uniref:Thiamine diphosphokinase n=2 Tax=Paenibacillus TaxID=44249 RepID=A0A1G5DZ57_9BACL|nr:MULTISPECIES: thiamine diphosphokinase [Paenibacillus]MBY0204859.1 thiamine diphosphokinase [Paenibacillus cucumis (ex Kampfer et al. 2016)]MCP1133453.1 thiamine diphosphokinase [Paenibacillus polysaccharolyticus]MDP9697396.1 thiamine pyrophosphokinase [Paenibacillus intestini]SCY20029.1 thiamine pyrophosphokinase [Paenibacillus polysaccharolyticus]